MFFLKVYFEATIDFILILVFVCTGFNLISSHIQIDKAQAFHASVIEKMESSECNPNVQNECYNIATNLGYQLEYEKAAIYDEHESYYIKLTYPVKMTFFGRIKYYSIEGYAR